MISETFFASNFTSIWRVLTPTMDEFVRRMNMDGYDRQWPPFASSNDPRRRGLVNEAAYLLFCLRSNDGGDGASSVAGIDAAFEAARKYIYSQVDVAERPIETPGERAEAAELAHRLFWFFRHPSRVPMSLAPRFRGCGMIDACVGDVLAQDGNLFEIKSGERAFRAIDYRQLLVYVALHYAETKQVYRRVNLINPRVGIWVALETEELADGLSGGPASLLCQKLVDAFSVSLASP